MIEQRLQSSLGAEALLEPVSGTQSWKSACDILQADTRFTTPCSTAPGFEHSENAPDATVYTHSSYAGRLVEQNSGKKAGAHHGRAISKALDSLKAASEDFQELENASNFSNPLRDLGLEKPDSNPPSWSEAHAILATAESAFGSHTNYSFCG